MQGFIRGPLESPCAHMPHKLTGLQPILYRVLCKHKSAAQNVIRLQSKKWALELHPNWQDLFLLNVWMINLDSKRLLLLCLFWFLFPHPLPVSGFTAVPRSRRMDVQNQTEVTSTFNCYLNISSFTRRVYKSVVIEPLVVSLHLSWMLDEVELLTIWVL